MTIRVLLLAALVATAAGCASIEPYSAQELASATPEHVDEFRYEVPLSVQASYRNTLGKARECWQQSTGILATTTFFVEADPFDAAVGHARIAVRVGRLVPTVVTLTPLAENRTLIVARRMKMRGAVHFASHKDLPHLEGWALGKPEPCRDRLLM